MGDPRKIRKKYDTPSHPWQSARIEVERKVKTDYGLKNKREIWKFETLLRDIKNQAKGLASRVDQQSILEGKQLMDRLVLMGLLQPGDAMEKVLGIELKDVMDRRLQTFLVKKGLARTTKQARQFITHGHILVNKKKATFPSFYVTIKDEGAIEFMPKSSLSRDDHPERVPLEENKPKSEKKKKKVAEEDKPAFNPEEIKQIDEKGAVESKPVEAEN